MRSLLVPIALTRAIAASPDSTVSQLARDSTVTLEFV